LVDQLSDRVLIDPVTTELDDIFLLGFDVWGDGATRRDYLNQCHASEKYRYGRWHVLTLNKKIVSALIVYTSGFNLPTDAYGIGSLATAPDCRGRSYASELMRRTLMRLDGDSNQRLVYLFADIDSSFYRRFGFTECHSSCGSVCMVRSMDPKMTNPELPNYF